jgi:hypothetical protein
MYKIMSSENEDSFFLFPIFVPFISYGVVSVCIFTFIFYSARDGTQGLAHQGKCSATELHPQLQALL